jgi:hypothetical protein
MADGEMMMIAGEDRRARGKPGEAAAQPIRRDGAQDRPSGGQPPEGDLPRRAEGGAEKRRGHSDEPCEDDINRETRPLLMAMITMHKWDEEETGMAD